MSKVFFNILIRTSDRPRNFATCLSSIRQQTYKNYQVLVAYDTPRTSKYLAQYADIIKVPVRSNAEPPPPRVDETRQFEIFRPNLYFNTLYEHVRDGFILFLDDDDQFMDRQALALLAHRISGNDALLFWRVCFSRYRLIPADSYFRKPPHYTQINTAGFAFHTKYLAAGQWDGWRGGDYYVAKKLYQAIPNKIYLDRALTGMQDQHNLPGMGLKIDKAFTMEELRKQYDRLGYLPPVRIMKTGEAHRFLKQVQVPPLEMPLDWEKGYAAGSRIFYELATQPAILERVAALLGPDILLWGCSIVAKKGGANHLWHCDVEATAPEKGRTLNVWVGLRNVNAKSGLCFIPFSHTFDKTVQQLRAEQGLNRQQAGDAQVLEWARERNADARKMRPDMSDGEALFFNGKMWHGSFNETQDTRYALLIQYATPDAAIRLPDINNFEWPFRQLAHPLPPVLLIRGDDRAGVNRIVQAPVSRNTTGKYLMSESRIYPLSLPLPLEPNRKWRPFPIFNGATAGLQHLTCHVSALAPGQQPHPPHTHPEEEILMILHGEADVLLPDLPDPAGRRQRLRRGDFVYYPAHFQHTLESVGSEPVNYLMLKWYNPVTNPPIECVTFGRYQAIDTVAASTGRPIRYGLLFEGPTNCLSKLHCHTTALQPGAYYAPHRDPYDVAIIVLEGQVQTLDTLVDAGQVIFYPAGTLHGMANPTEQIARYVVFEFHGQQSLEARRIKPDALLTYTASAIPVGAGVVEEARFKELQQEYRALRSSFSFRLGRGITRGVEQYLGWIPYVKKSIAAAGTTSRKREKAV